MAVASRHRLSLRVLVAGAVLLASAAVRAAETDVGASESATLRKEWVGLELTPVSYATSQPPADGRANTPFSALQTGPGGTLRVGRYRFEQGYIIPFMSSLYVSGGDKTMKVATVSTSATE